MLFQGASPVTGDASVQLEMSSQFASPVDVFVAEIFVQPPSSFPASVHPFGRRRWRRRPTWRWRRWRWRRGADCQRAAEADALDGWSRPYDRPPENRSPAEGFAPSDLIITARGWPACLIRCFQDLSHPALGPATSIRSPAWPDLALAGSADTEC